jgi:nitroreductase
MLTRRSVRKYKPDMPPREDIEQIVQAGLYGASGKGRQSTVLIAVTNKDLRDRLSVLNRKYGGWPEDSDPFYGAPAVVLVLAKKNSVYVLQDGSLAMGNLMLAAHALGLGSCWVNRIRETFESDEGKAILKELGVEDELTGVGGCILGYIDGEAPAAMARRPGRVYWAE